jgi:hypothetical protein
MNRNLEPYYDNYSCPAVRTGRLGTTVYSECELFNIIDRGFVIIDTKYKLPHFKYVNDTFICSYMELYSLTGSPRYVGGNFMCQGNHLELVYGCPLYVGGNFQGWNFQTPPKHNGTIIINKISYDY